MNQAILGKIVIFCPSLNRPCGIARYSEYISAALLDMGIDVSIVGTIRDAERLCGHDHVTLIIQHEYGIYDRNTRAHEAPTTSELMQLDRVLSQKCNVYRSCIVMHTYHGTDHVHALENLQLLSSGIPIYHLNSLGASLYGLNYLEHGVCSLASSSFSSPIASATADQDHRRKTSSDTFSIGTFGILSPNKNFKGLIDCAAEAGVGIVANLATHDKTAAEALRSYANEANVHLRLTSHFATEDQLLGILRQADICVSLQDDINHYATSGSARFMLNAGLPLVTTQCRQFVDFGEAAIQAVSSEIPSIIDELRSNSDYYRHQACLVKGFAKANDLGGIYLGLIHDLARRGTGISESFRVYATGEKYWQPASSLLSLDDIPSIDLLADMNLEALNEHLISNCADRLRVACGPVKRLGCLAPNEVFGANSFERSSLIRHLAPFELIREGFDLSLRISGEREYRHSNRDAYRAMRSMADMRYSDRIDLLDSALSPGVDSSAMAAVSADFNTWILSVLFETKPIDGCISSALTTTMYLEGENIEPFLKLLIPSMSNEIESFIHSGPCPPQRLAKRWRWLSDLLSHLCDKRLFVGSCPFPLPFEASYIQRHFFFLEEFLWPLDRDFSNVIQLCFLKQSPNLELSDLIVARLRTTCDSHAERLAIILEYMDICFWEKGYPVMLVTFLSGENSLAIPFSRCRRHARFFFEHDIRVANSRIRPARSPLRGKLLESEGDREMLVNLRNLENSPSAGHGPTASTRVKEMVSNACSMPLENLRIILP